MSTHGALNRSGGIAIRSRAAIPGLCRRRGCTRSRWTFTRRAWSLLATRASPVHFGRAAPWNVGYNNLADGGHSICCIALLSRSFAPAATALQFRYEKSIGMGPRLLGLGQVTTTEASRTYADWLD